jgi:hypothetical protein
MIYAGEWKLHLQKPEVGNKTRRCSRQNIYIYILCMVEVQDYNAVLNSQSDHLVGGRKIHRASLVVAAGWYPLNLARNILSHSTFRHSSLPPFARGVLDVVQMVEHSTSICCRNSKCALVGTM